MAPVCPEVLFLFYVFVDFKWMLLPHPRWEHRLALFGIHDLVMMCACFLLACAYFCLHLWRQCVLECSFVAGFWMDLWRQCVLES